MTVYLDVIWALNFFIDTLLLYLTAIVLKRKIKYWRLIVGGLVGSLIILLSITPLNTFSSHPIGKIIFSIGMILIVFQYGNFRLFIQALSLFYLLTFLIGGILIGTHYFIQFDASLNESIAIKSIYGFGDPISWLFVFIGFPLAWHFSKKRLEDIETTKVKYEKIVPVKIKIFGNQVELKGLIDSGNNVYDPISKMPVMFVSIDNKEEFPEAIKKLAMMKPDDLFVEEDEFSWLEDKIRLIPYKVVGQEHQLVIGVKPEEILIEYEGEDIVVKKGFVSFTNQNFSSEDAFQCIIHPKMITGMNSRKKSEKVS